MNELRPTTVEALAVFCEKAGLLAAAVIRQHPKRAHHLAYTLFHVVSSALGYAIDMGTCRLLDSAVAFTFDYTWRIALNQALTDLTGSASETFPTVNQQEPPATKPQDGPPVEPPVHPGEEAPRFPDRGPVEDWSKLLDDLLGLDKLDEDNHSDQD